MDQSKQLRREPTIIELRAKALFFGIQACRSKWSHTNKDPHPWCVEQIADPESSIAMRGKWFATEYQALEEFLEYSKIHGYPKG